jgi:hypothetical protein
VLDSFIWLFNDPQPIRKCIRAAIRGTKIGSPLFRHRIGAIGRPNYSYLVYEAALLAHRLGHERVSILEFGVAGGSGLLALEQHAEWVEKIIPVKIEIYGFDTGIGLPPPKDYRDLPYHWKPGFFKMDQESLKQKLKRATLVLGDIKETLKTFITKYNPAPIGAVSHDMDFYSSTRDGLTIFEADDRFLLPRIYCYFDDVVGDNFELYGDFTGERLAICEFNDQHTDRKLSPAYYLKIFWGFQKWHHQIWTLHKFSHVDYNKFISTDNQQLPIGKEF